ncbi:sphingomyelin phosphodiesterase 2 isoform X1 [Lynx rufus]|uniref:sphingomyelin phosphodiesterase 2 isoform X1 n=2 Tax=Lynx rufus TaxID=61384 RepID=UPI001F1231C2|nr:sphingomyelin phosphodiesterase 2 isoform X1 [Lynx rufus]
MKPNFSLRLRIFNLNCWGIPYLSKHRGDRVKRLGDFLNMESFDLALLEEVWSEQDFQYLRQKLLPTYPAAHYFRSGVIGSGLCVFSKHPIQEFTQHVYTLNGYPYMIHHGDWFCGKAVGLLVLHLSGLVLNAYVTHLHAEYNRQKDIYLAHRVAQAWELAQFIQCVSLGLTGEVGWGHGLRGGQGPTSRWAQLVRRELLPHQPGSPSHTSKKADVVLLCGDLNLHPKDLGCRLLKEWTGLHDAYLETRDFKGSEEGCTMVPENCYVNQRELQPFPFGIRIDYVLYKAVSGFYISCKTLRTTTGRDPHSGTPLSDHEALMATLCVRHSPPQHTPSPTHGPAERSRLISVLKEAWAELDLGMAQARWWATFAGYVIGLGLLLLALLCALAAGGGVREVAIMLWTPSVGLLLGAGAVYLFHVQEAKGLSRARAELQHMLGRAREAHDLDPESQAALFLGQQEGDRSEEQ